MDIEVSQEVEQASLVDGMTAVEVHKTSQEAEDAGSGAGWIFLVNTLEIRNQSCIGDQLQRQIKCDGVNINLQLGRTRLSWKYLVALNIQGRISLDGGIHLHFIFAA